MRRLPANRSLLLWAAMVAGCAVGSEHPDVREATDTGPRFDLVTPGDDTQADDTASTSLEDVQADGAPAMDAADAGAGMDAFDGGSAADVARSDDVVPGIGASCAAGGMAGVCLYTGDCAARGGTSTAGLCPGPAAVQCCTMAGGGDASTGSWDALASGCPADMISLPGYCMDQYEAPNQAGVAPLAMQNALEGVAWCEARGKRLCTEAEWMTACEGSRGTLYPYGSTHVAHRCNDDKTWIAPDWTTLDTWPSSAAMTEAARLYQADPSGSRTACASEQGVMDLTGNVAEWVVRSFPNANNYDHVMKGCYWSGCFGGALPNCTFVNPAHPSGFHTYEAGFRCCLTP